MKLWQSLGDEAVSQWQIRWEDAQRAANLSNLNANNYTVFVRSAPSLALDLAQTLNDAAIGQTAKCVDVRQFEDTATASRLVFGGLDMSVRSSLSHIALQFAARGFNGNLTNVAQIEADKVSRHLQALSASLAQRMEQRAIECRRADAIEARQVRADQREGTKLWISIATPLVTAAGGALWAIFVNFTQGASAVFVSLLTLGVAAFSHHRSGGGGI